MLRVLKFMWTEAGLHGELDAMRSKIHLPNRVNDAKNNIKHVQFPFHLLSGNQDNSEGKRPMVIFLGEDFRNLPNTDLDRAMHISNQCLDYIRRECGGCELYYKPHPTETDEHTMLDLKGFTMMERVPVELAFMKYAGCIRHVFSTCSTASRIAYDFGLNSSVFLDPIAPALDQRTLQGFRELLSMLPDECFIRNFSQPLQENRKEMNSDGVVLDEQIRTLVTGRRGTVWMLIGDPNALPYAKVIDMLVRKHNPEMLLHLVVSWHHRWKTMPIDEVEKLFNSVSFIPRLFYSLRPEKLLRAWQAARLIRAWPIGKEDVIISRLGLAFTDDCFASYFPYVSRIALMPKDFFDLACGRQTLDTEWYRRRLGAVFFNCIIEPLLNIERTEYFEDKRRIVNIYRYMRPLNDVFDTVWVY